MGRLYLKNNSKRRNKLSKRRNKMKGNKSNRRNKMKRNKSNRRNKMKGNNSKRRIKLSKRRNKSSKSISKKKYKGGNLIEKSFTYDEGEYTISELIATGNYGEVYKVEANGHTYALKAITKFSSADTNEINILRKLSNINDGDQRKNNVIKIFSDLFNIDGLGRKYKGFFILEYADGILGPQSVHCNLIDAAGGVPGNCTSVGQYIKECKNRVDLLDISNIFLQMYDGLCFCHDNNVIHLDIKPTNFVIAGGVIKLVDFGLSVDDWDESDAPKKLSQEPRARGSPSYMSPEALGYSKYGKKTDLWALGVILYNLVTLTLPFTAPPGNLAALLYSVMENNPPSIKDDPAKPPAIYGVPVEPPAIYGGHKFDKTMDKAMINELTKLQRMSVEELKGIAGGGKDIMLGGTLPKRIGNTDILDIIDDIIKSLLVSNYDKRNNYNSNIDSLRKILNDTSTVDWSDFVIPFPPREDE